MKHTIKKIEIEECDICDGTGVEELFETECNSETGHNPIQYATGKIIPCVECCKCFYK